MILSSPGITPPPWLREKAKKNPGLALFIDDQRFHDDIHGRFYLSQLERDLLDTPEFQRLFRISQLGFVDLIFPTSNHTRAGHSIGVCTVSKRLVELVNANTARVYAERRRYGRNDDNSAVPRITFSSSILISLGALLHDVSHGPFSHDIEKKKHELLPLREGDRRTPIRSHYGPYPKHDDFENHPVLYLTLLDPDVSVMARVLRAYSPLFWDLLQLEAKQEDGQELRRFVELAAQRWPTCEEMVLPSLLFHLLVFEKPEESGTGSRQIAVGFNAETIPWGLGPDEAHSDLHTAWYQPYRHDIIGDTISADLIDYLLRDVRRLGISREVDGHFLEFYVLTPTRAGLVGDAPLFGDQRSSYRCVMDINDYKRGTLRHDVVNEIFRLLDLRFEIHEKAVFHRVVQSAIAMLSRAIYLLNDQRQKPGLPELYGFHSSSGGPSLSGEDAFLLRLISASRGPQAQTIPQKLAERRVYRPLIVMPGDQIDSLFQGLAGPFGEQGLRELAAIVDSEYYAPFFCFMSWCIEHLLQHAFEDVAELRSHVDAIRSHDELLRDAMRRIPKRVIFWALPYKQLYKDPAIMILAHPHNTACGLEELLLLTGTSGEELRALQERVRVGIENAGVKYASLWKLFVFISDGLFYTGVLAKAIQGHPCAGLGGDVSHRAHLASAQALVVETLRAVWKSWKGEGPRKKLDAKCPESEFRVLLGCVGNPEEEQIHHNPTAIANRISAVAVEQYLHTLSSESPLVGVPAQCRDARYKFSPGFKGDLAVILGRRRDLNVKARSWIGSFIEAVGRHDWTEDELDELIDRLQVIPKRIANPVPAQKAARAFTDYTPLRLVWRDDPAWEEKWRA